MKARTIPGFVRAFRIETARLQPEEIGLVSVESVDGALGYYPNVGLPCDRGYVFEVGVVVNDYRTVELGDGGGYEIDDAYRAVQALSREQLLDLTGTVGDRFVDRKVDVQGAAALRDVL